MRQRQHEKLPFGEFQKVVECQMAFAFERPLSAFAAGEQLTQPAVGNTVARIDQDVGRAVDENDARSDQKPWLVLDLGITEFLESAHHAGQRVVVGDADDGNPQISRLMHILLRMRTAAQERKIRGDADFRIG